MPVIVTGTSNNNHFAVIDFTVLGGGSTAQGTFSGRSGKT
jgi:hypothetical protein